MKKIILYCLLCCLLSSCSVFKFGATGYTLPMEPITSPDAPRDLFYSRHFCPHERTAAIGYYAYSDQASYLRYCQRCGARVPAHNQQDFKNH